MLQHPTIKIVQIEPKQQNFQLQFQISEIISKNEGILVCRIVDETAIIDACFDKYADKLEKSGVYLMTNLKCGLHNRHPRVEMQGNTIVSKEPHIFGFKDKTNDISKLVYEQKLSSEKQIKLPELQRKAESLKILTKEQAKQEIKMMKEYQQMRNQKKKEHQHSHVYKEKHEFQNEKGQNKPTNYHKQKERDLNMRNEEKNFKNQDKSKQQDFVEQKNKKQRHKYKQKVQQTKAEKEDEGKNKKYVNNKNAKDHTTEQKNKNAHKYELKKENKQGSQENEKTTQKQQLKLQPPQKATTHESQKIFNIVHEKRSSTEKRVINVQEILNQQIGEYANLKVYITGKVKNKEGNDEKQIQIADSSGAAWLKVNKLNLQEKQRYEIDGLEVCQQQDRLFFKQSELAEARRIEGSFPFSFKEVGSKLFSNAQVIPQPSKEN